MLEKVGIAILIIVIIVNSAACGAMKMNRYEAEFVMLFDTLTKVVAYTGSKKEFTKYSQLIYDNLKEYHELYDIYNTYDGINNIKTINDNAGIAPVEVDQRIIDLILFGKEWYKKTGGKINIAYGAVLKIWHYYRTMGTDNFENARLPPVDELKAAAEHTDINKIIIDEEKSTVFLDDLEMSIDVGAVGKGYAVERVSQIAVENGFKKGLISVGGNVRVIGSKGEENKPWNVGIQSPDSDNRQSDIHIVNLIDSSLVSSGNYERFYTVNGKRYHHIIDPETLFPSEYFTSVTIICRDSGIADALSTAVFNMPFEKGCRLVEDLPGIEAMWVLSNGETRYSSNFKRFLKQ